MPSHRRRSFAGCLALATAACASSSPSRPAADAAAELPAAEVPGTSVSDGPQEADDGAPADAPLEGPAACDDPSSGPTFADWPIADPAGMGAGVPPSFDTSRAGVVLDRV